jgi:hypothetical protein
MRLRHVLLSLLLIAVTPASAAASSWSTLGAGPARAGHDAFDHGATTNVVESWSQTAGAEQNVVAGPVVSDGIPGTQRVVYGTSNLGVNALHVQMLSNGMQVGPQAGHDIDDGGLDADTFGADDAVISPVIASSPFAPGQVYALHNDDGSVAGTGDIALAQVDLATGTLVQDVPVPDTDGYEVQSSPVLTDPGDDASLFFVASDPLTPGSTRLFRLDITGVHTSSASFAADSTSTPVPAANTLASPTLVYLNDAAGVPTLYVAVGTSGLNALETYAVTDFSAGPQASATGEGETPSVPLTSDGLLPGAPGSGMDTSPWIYMATDPGSVFSQVNRLEQFGNSQTLDVLPSAPLNGAPAHALAVSKRVGADFAEGVVAFTTSDDLYLLETGDLSLRAEYNVGPTFANFGSTTAALSDDLVFAMLFDGRQKVLRTSDATEVPLAEFTENSLNLGSTAAKGQPALAGGKVIFPSNLGAFAYTTRDGTPPRVGNLAPASVLGGGVLEATAADARGIRDVRFYVDGVLAGVSTNSVSGHSHTPSGGRFIAGWDAGATAPGEHTLQAIATDNGGQSSSAKATIVVEPHTTLADTDPPETEILSRPRARSSDTTPRFRFSSSEEPEAFQCSLDRRAYRSCPARYEIEVVAGRHRLRVRAVDAAGNVDPTPAVDYFRVRAPRAVEVVTLKPIELDRRGRVPVPVTCHSRRRCRGVLALYVFVPRRSRAATVEAIAARKGRKLRVGRRGFSVAPRTRRKVLVRVSAAGRRLLRRHGRLKALTTVRLDTPTGNDLSRWRLTLTTGDD